MKSNYAITTEHSELLKEPSELLKEPLVWFKILSLPINYLAAKGKLHDAKQLHL